MKYPAFVTLILRGEKVKCRYDYWPGEAQRSSGPLACPGSEPEATVTQVFWCGGWENAETELTPDEQAELDEQLYEVIQELEAWDRDNEPEEREYE